MTVDWWETAWAKFCPCRVHRRLRAVVRQTMLDDGYPPSSGAYWRITRSDDDLPQRGIAITRIRHERGEAMTPGDIRTYKTLIGILAQHVSETGESEGAVDVLNRLLQEHDCPLERRGHEAITSDHASSAS